MPDTGKMKRLFVECTTSIMMGQKETMVYPEGDLDGIAEQLALHIKYLEKSMKEIHDIGRAAEERVAYVMGEVRRAHKSLGVAIKGAIRREARSENPSSVEDVVNHVTK